MEQSLKKIKTHMLGMQGRGRLKLLEKLVGKLHLFRQHTQSFAGAHSKACKQELSGVGRLYSASYGPEVYTRDEIN